MVALDQEFRKRAGETIENYLRILSGTFLNRQNISILGNMNMKMTLCMDLLWVNLAV
jgi:hypothetical protein